MSAAGCTVSRASDFRLPRIYNILPCIARASAVELHRRHDTTQCTRGTRWSWYRRKQSRQNMHACTTYRLRYGIEQPQCTCVSHRSHAGVRMATATCRRVYVVHCLKHGAGERAGFYFGHLASQADFGRDLGRQVVVRPNGRRSRPASLSGDRGLSRRHGWGERRRLGRKREFEASRRMAIGEGVFPSQPT